MKRPAAQNVEVSASGDDCNALVLDALDDLFPDSPPSSDTTPYSRPAVTGQCALVLDLIREHQPFLSFRGTADFAVPEFAARVHDLRAMGFYIITAIKRQVIFRGRIRRKAALYSLGTPEWPAPGFLDQSKGIAA